MGRHSLIRVGQRSHSHEKEDRKSSARYMAGEPGPPLARPPDEGGTTGKVESGPLRILSGVLWGKDLPPKRRLVWQNAKKERRRGILERTGTEGGVYH